MKGKPICLRCRNLVWAGFYAHCIRILMPDSTLKEAIELDEAQLKGKMENEVAVIEQQQEMKFEKSLECKLMSIPYMVWRRKNVVHYNPCAPRKEQDCPFRFEPVPNLNSRRWLRTR